MLEESCNIDRGVAVVLLFIGIDAILELLDRIDIIICFSLLILEMHLLSLLLAVRAIVKINIRRAMCHISWNRCILILMVGMGAKLEISSFDMICIVYSSYNPEYN